MERENIERLLEPYVCGRPLSGEQLGYISTYIDILLRWNARTNLTAVRDPEEIVRRHFGESVFAARMLLSTPVSRMIDVGSGAGFPGLAMKVVEPSARLTLIESQGKKATFLREAVRAIGLSEVQVIEGRAEQVEERGELVTFRAVEKFESILTVASRLVSLGGRLAMLVGTAQIEKAKHLLPGDWAEPVAIPGSTSRAVVAWHRTSG